LIKLFKNLAFSLKIILNSFDNTAEAPPPPLQIAESQFFRYFVLKRSKG
jgi:hypothetical protein